MYPDFAFPNPANPWQTGFPETIEINALRESIGNLDFIAIKMGDLSYDAKTN